MKLGDLEGDEFLKKGWDDLEGEHMQSWVESEENKWTAEQVGSLFLFGGSRRSESGMGFGLEDLADKCLLDMGVRALRWEEVSLPAYHSAFDQGQRSVEAGQARV